MESEGVKELKLVEIAEIRSFEKYLNIRENQTYGGSLSSRAIYAYLAAVRQFFEQEVQRGSLVKNPMSGYKKGGRLKNAGKRKRAALRGQRSELRGS